MRARHLESEMRQAVACLSTAQIERLIGLGVSPFDVAVHHLVGTARVVLWGRRRELWRPAAPDELGVEVFVVPVRVQHAAAPFASNPWMAIRFGDLIDLIAWEPDTPGGWLLRTGEGKWLGAAAPAILDPFPVRIHPTPLAWLVARGDGLVLLSRRPERQAEVLAYFHGRGLIVADRLHHAQLRHVLDAPLRSPATPITIHQ